MNQQRRQRLQKIVKKGRMIPQLFKNNIQNDSYVAGQGRKKLRYRDFRAFLSSRKKKVFYNFLMFYYI